MAKTTAVDQLEKMVTIAKDNFSPERYEKVEQLFEHFADRIVVAPASGKVHFHNCYPGGYLDHVHNVIAGVVHVATAMKKLGAEIDFTREEAIFSAMFHDLGKLGSLDEPYYIPQASDWHRENRGELFVHNPELPYMGVTDQALYLLSHFGIPVTTKEWLAIKVSDGLYAEANKPYLISYAYPPPPFHTNLHHVVHWADHMATVAEHDAARLENDE